MNLMFEWPQITYMVLLFLALSISAVRNGEPRGDYNFGVSFMASLIVLFILYRGGFFS